MVEPRPNMDDDDMMALHETRPDVPQDEPISEQEGAIEERVEAQPASPGALDLEPEKAFEALKEQLRQAHAGVREVVLNERRALAAGETPFMALIGQDMAFRLRGEAHYEAWRLDASKLWDVDPAVHEAPETEWVILRYKHSRAWERFARAALQWAQEPPAPGE